MHAGRDRYWYDTNTLETSWQPPAETKVSPKAAPVGGAALPKRGEPGYGQVWLQFLRAPATAQEQRYSAAPGAPRARRAAGGARSRRGGSLSGQLEQGAGLPVAKEDWDFPGMNLIFGEAMLKDILVPEVCPRAARPQHPGHPRPRVPRRSVWSKGAGFQRGPDVFWRGAGVGRVIRGKAIWGLRRTRSREMQARQIVEMPPGSMPCGI